ncbi:MAG: hypothetical protein NPIRA02_31520 [Nitrospirales bacterium]|nr:MAG: hypothetical protein NPIRA02_31520 [Nitrospirales bacterium]
MRLTHVTTSSLVLFLSIAACTEGRWVHPIKTEPQALEDWNTCKTEVLAGTEYEKNAMAGGINLTGCMRSKGYRYVDEQQANPPNNELHTPQQNGLDRENRE